MTIQVIEGQLNQGNEGKYGTSTRMKGMLTVAKEVG